MRYLSDDWIAAADSTLAGSWKSVEDKGDTNTAITYTVKDAPDGEGGKAKATWTVTFGPDGAGVSAGSANGEPDATMELAYDAAVAIAKGETSPQVSFMQGQLKLGGDVTLLIRGSDRLAKVGDALRSLRDDTDF